MANKICPTHGQVLISIKGLCGKPVATKRGCERCGQRDIAKSELFRGPTIRTLYHKSCAGSITLTSVYCGQSLVEVN